MRLLITTEITFRNENKIISYQTNIFYFYEFYGFPNEIYGINYRHQQK
jgi:aromatic ring-opening dioxygenase catalytic subunit (LigB family)